MGVKDFDQNRLSLEEVGHFYGGLSGKSGKDFGKGNSRYITFLNVINNIVARIELTELVEIEKSEQQNKVSAGDLLFNGSSETPEEVAFPSLVTKELEGFYLNSFCFGFRFEKFDRLDPLFFAYYLRSQYGRQFMSQLAQGSTRYNISKTALLKLEWTLPDLSEQKVIAEALSDIDGLIESTKALKTKKIMIKKGYLDSIISGETFTSRAIKIKLAEYLEFFNGYSFQSSTYSNTGHYLIRISNVQSGQLVRNDDVCVNLENSKLKQFELNAGDIVISLTGNVGRSAIIEHKNIPAALNQRVGKIEIKINKVKMLNKKYFYQILQSQKFMDLVIEMGEGAAQKNVSLRDIGSIEWYIPEDSQEQLRISNFLNDLDNEIDLLGNALQKYELLKQGIMNDLLTGKVSLV